MAQLIDQAQVERFLESRNGWQKTGDAIQKAYKFKGFPEAVAFVDQLVKPAEAANHHPDIAINYNKVTLTLSTHDAGGLTEKDFALADTIDELH
jgi:4a-hydroxytetrahydrobiopterin dehydratase